MNATGFPGGIRWRRVSRSCTDIWFFLLYSPTVQGKLLVTTTGMSCLVKISVRLQEDCREWEPERQRDVGSRQDETIGGYWMSASFRSGGDGC
jgi:hypothetical protein